MSNILFSNNNRKNSFMLRVDLTYIYDLLQSINLLTNLDHRFYPNIEHETIIPNILKAYHMLSPSIYIIRSSYDCIQQLKDLLEEYYKAYVDSEQNLETPYIDNGKLQNIANTSLKLQFLLRSELAIQQVYLITTKGAYDIEMLMYAPESAFSSTLLDKIPETKYDITECAKALAFELPTACAFHLMRVFERVVRKYCSTRKTEKVDNNSSETLGKIIADLRPANEICTKDQNCQKKAKSSLFDILESIKDNYRNPIMHPEINMNMEEVLVLFGVVNGAISLMLKELNVIEMLNEQT